MSGCNVSACVTCHLHGMQVFEKRKTKPNIIHPEERVSNTKQDNNNNRSQVLVLSGKNSFHLDEAFQVCAVVVKLRERRRNSFECVIV